MNKTHSLPFKLTLAITAIALTAGCAHQNSPKDPRDPYEPVNRVVYKMNKNVDKVVFKPVAIAYRTAVPAALRNVAGNVFRNVSDVPSSANALLQGDPQQAAVSAFRVAVNTTLGIGGMFDLASDMGLKRRQEDFGQTLAVWGWKDSSYLVLPILGPRTIRDIAGLGPDYYFTPVNYLDPKIRNYYGLSYAIQQRTELLETEKLLDTASVDEYVMVRNAYFEHRNYLIRNGEGEEAAANGEFLDGPPE